MKYVLNGDMARKVDEYTIEQMGLPSMVLMERAALSVATKAAQMAAGFKRSVRICAVCGCGKNGADGIAAARILIWQGLMVDIMIVGDTSSACEEFTRQVEIVANSGINFSNIQNIPEYDIVIDAIFGTGLNREVSGQYADVIRLINNSSNLVISVDIPSGTDATTGRILGISVAADITVTFGYNKQGLMLYPGKEYAGEVTVADIGFCPEAIRELNPAMYFTMEDLKGIPKRIDSAHKGTYMRTLVIAGSKDMSGAAMLSAAAAYRTGAGLLEVFTHSDNVGVIRSLLPEAIVRDYSAVSERLDKADIIIIGPGLSTDETAVELCFKVFSESTVPIIADADALNIIAVNPGLLEGHSAPVIITPHIGEMARLTGTKSSDIASDPIKAASDFADRYNVICALKDAVTVVCEPSGMGGRKYINNSGCAAMAKAGMGDVLCGVIAGMLSLRIEPFSAACAGVYIHGLAGEAACENISSHSVLAGDLLKEFGRVMECR